MRKMNLKTTGIVTLAVAVSLISGAAWAGCCPEHQPNSTKAACESPAGSQTAVTLTDHYLAIQSALAGDSLEKISEHAAAISELAAASKSDQPVSATVSSSADKLAKATTIVDARLAFGDLSELLVKADEMIPGEGLKVAYCSMAGKHWLQRGTQIANPYFGSGMLRCGNFVQ